MVYPTALFPQPTRLPNRPVTSCWPMVPGCAPCGGWPYFHKLNLGFEYTTWAFLWDLGAHTRWFIHSLPFWHKTQQGLQTLWVYQDLPWCTPLRVPTHLNQHLYTYKKGPFHNRLSIIRVTHVHRSVTLLMYGTQTIC